MDVYITPFIAWEISTPKRRVSLCGSSPYKAGDQYLGAHNPHSAVKVVFSLVEVHGSPQPPCTPLHFPKQLSIKLLHLHASTPSGLSFCDRKLPPGGAACMHVHATCAGPWDVSCTGTIEGGHRNSSVQSFLVSA